MRDTVKSTECTLANGHKIEMENGRYIVNDGITEDIDYIKEVLKKKKQVQL